MNRLSVIVLTLALSLGAAHGDAQAQMKKVAQTGLQFLKIDMSARAAAMGGAYSMVGDDASAMMYNPAGMTAAESFDLFVSRSTWMSDISYNAAGIIKNLGPSWGTFGVSIRAADYGEIIGTRVTGDGYEETGQVDVGAFAVGLAYAKQLSTRFSVGGQVSYASQQLGSNVIDGAGTTEENTVNGLSYDLGTMYYPGLRSLRLGMSLRNFSQQFQYVDDTFELPLTFQIGFAADVFDFIGRVPNSTLMVALDAVHPRDYAERIHVGAEYMYGGMFAIRGGYKFNYDIESFSVGFGIRQEVGGIGLKLDYAYSDLDLFGNSNRFSLGIAF